MEAFTESRELAPAQPRTSPSGRSRWCPKGVRPASATRSWSFECHLKRDKLFTELTLSHGRTLAVIVALPRFGCPARSGGDAQRRRRTGCATLFTPHTIRNEVVATYTTPPVSKVVR